MLVPSMVQGGLERVHSLGARHNSAQDFLLQFAGGLFSSLRCPVLLRMRDRDEGVTYENGCVTHVTDA